MADQKPRANKWALIFSVMLAGVGIFPQAQAQSELKISGGVSAVVNIFDQITVPFEKKTGVKLVFTNKDPKGHGGDLVFIDVDTGVAEAGAAGTTFVDWVKQMKDKGYEAKNVGEMKSRVIGKDLIVFITSKGGPKHLSEDQLKDLLGGKYANWKQLGGEDLPVKLVLPGKLPSLINFVEKRFLGGTKINRANAKVQDQGEVVDLVKTISSTPGSYTFGPVNLVTSEVNVPEHPQFGRPITMIWRGAPSKNLTQLLEFIATEGKKYGVAQ